MFRFFKALVMKSEAGGFLISILWGPLSLFTPLVGVVLSLPLKLRQKEDMNRIACKD